MDGIFQVEMFAIQFKELWVEWEREIGSITFAERTHTWRKKSARPEYNLREFAVFSF